jgi:hypothetical protein
MSAVSLAAFRIARPRVARSKRMSSSYSMVAVGEWRTPNNMKPNTTHRELPCVDRVGLELGGDGRGGDEDGGKEGRDGEGGGELHFLV